MMTADTGLGIVPVLTDGDELFADLHLCIAISLISASDPSLSVCRPWARRCLTDPARPANE